MAVTSWFYIGTAANDNSGSGSGGVAWLTPSGAVGTSGSSGSYGAGTSCPVDKSYSQYLKMTNSGISIPGTATVNGIEIFSNSDGAGTIATWKSFKIVKAGTISGNEMKNSGTFGNFTAGGATELFGLSWTPSDISDSGFGFAICGQSTQNGDTITSAGGRMRVYYTDGDTPTVSSGVNMDKLVLHGVMQGVMHGVYRTAQGLWAPKPKKLFSFPEFAPSFALAK